MKPIGFISGHLDLTQAEFDKFYAPIIKPLALYGHGFVVGDARGADTLAQTFLSQLKQNIPELNITVYHMFGSPRNNVGIFPIVGGFLSDDARDVAMTNASKYDIAWVRPGRENSGTARNIKRRQFKI